MIQQIISAQEAIDLTNKEIQTDDSDLLPIMDVIRNAIKRKEYYCHFSGIIREYTKDKLKKLGYKVEYCKGGGDQREPDYYKISWEYTYAYPDAN
jgi:hypothetical protein